MTLLPRSANFFSSASALGLLFSLLQQLAAPAWGAQSLGFSISRGPADNELVVDVLDERDRSPVAAARVLVGESLQSPQQDSVTAFTDAQGRARFAPLSGLKAVTVERPGLLRFSVVGVAPGSRLTAYLRAPRDQASDILANGTLTGWQDRGNRVKAGLVFRTLEAADLLEFNLSSLISTLEDTIDVFGKRRVPSNVVLPDQRVSIVIGSIRLNKPDFRLPMSPRQEVRLGGVQGDAAATDLIGKHRGFEILNKLRFRRLALAPQSVDARSDFHQDLNADIALAPAHDVTVDRPPFASDVLIAHLCDLQGDRDALLPTDVKLGVSVDRPGEVKSVKLSAPPAGLFASQLIASIAMADDGARLSGILSPVGSAPTSVRPGEFLEAAAPSPEAPLPNAIPLQAPAKGIGAVLFEPRPAGGWLVYALPSAGSVNIPASALPPDWRLQSYSIVKLEFGRDFDEREINGFAVMNSLSRFARTRNRVK